MIFDAIVQTFFNVNVDSVRVAIKS